MALPSPLSYEFPRRGIWMEGMDWEVMNRLHEQGYTGNPKSKAKSVKLTEEGARLSEAL